MKRIIILGGGASGIAAAISAAEKLSGRGEVLLLEKNPRVGKKLLATGNGRCNFGNEDISPERYFTGDKPRAAALLDTIAQHPPERWLSRHGLLSRSEDGRLYPYSNQAADLLNLLLHWLERSGVKVRTGCAVTALSYKGNGFSVEYTGGRVFGNAVICALGGSAAPQFGTDGFGLELARRCGCKTEPAYPCLVPLKCKKEQLSGLSGIRVKAAASLLDGERPIHAETGEVQFTDYGLSGIAVMQLSGLLSPKSGVGSPVISLDLFPDMALSELLELISSRSSLFGEAPVSELFTGLLNRRVAMAVIKRAGIDASRRLCRSLSPDELSRLARTLKDWRFDSLSALGWQQAQATGGGIALSCIESQSFAFTGADGLYFVGETLDCTGFCGGFNLHWAFGSGIAAGLHAAGRLLSGT